MSRDKRESGASAAEMEEVDKLLRLVEQQRANENLEQAEAVIKKVEDYGREMERKGQELFLEEKRMEEKVSCIVLVLL